MNINYILIFLSFRIFNCSECEKKDVKSRINCYPEANENEAECLKRECCWSPSDLNIPKCFYPKNFTNYKVVSKDGLNYLLRKEKPTFRPNEILELNLKISFVTKNTLRLEITDPKNERYRVKNMNKKKNNYPLNDYEYYFYVNEDPFYIKIFRASTGKIIFDSSIAPLIYADQYIQFSTTLQNDYFYGLGGPKNNLARDTNWTRYSSWNRQNITHPFYMTVDQDGNSMGLYLQNSNAIEVLSNPMPSLTFITIGGILDIFVYLGPYPSDVIFQHTQVVGTPQIPQYFTLGFHLSRWGYNSSANLENVINRNREIGIPYDVQWTYIDALENKLDWTFDTINFDSLPAIVKDLHDNDQYYIHVVQPGIRNITVSFDQGIQQNVFIKYLNSSENLIGILWSDTVVYPDFTNPNSSKWWSDQASTFYKIIPYDGLWINMNEPLNFVDGSIKGCSVNKYDYPPYLPEMEHNLFSKTICPSAEQYLSNHFNLHSMYGHFESIATNNALRLINDRRRPFVLTRSSFAGTGHYAAQLTRENSANWEDLYFSIPEILSFSILGITQVGADICGFNGDTSEELCIRWMQLGAFYPLMRNHNSLNSKDQDPAAFSPQAQEIMKKALMTRYTLLPYFYTLFYASSQIGDTVARPLFIEYPNDLKTHKIDRQFMVGESILITPVLEQNAKIVQGYFPNDTWYDFRSGTKLDLSKSNYVNFYVTLDDIPVHIKGGRIIPFQQPDINTKRARKNSFGLIVALKNNRAVGYFYWDDGESFDSKEKKIANYFLFFADNQGLEVQRNSYKYETNMILSDIRVYGVDQPIKEVRINDILHENFTYDEINKVLEIFSFKIDMLADRSIEFSWI
ncbi:unnamed protein product [Brachionus calyciflorus]|uniref:P-type domain-containing protein n=1 Tax=Brachionus calyciflorus TaxID=104777 RepID=A0A813ZKL3_9BILA|nr:unnamed protein product [Brachionus calyciflorus]